MIHPLLTLILGLLIAYGKATSENKIKKKLGKRNRFKKATRKRKLALQNFRCNRCYRSLEQVDFHHIDGVRTNNDISNCEALCPNCHAKKTRKKKFF